MSDIVARLTNDFVKSGNDEGEECACIMCEAAAEIQRLRSTQSGTANLQAILDDHPYCNSALSVYQIKTILANEGGFMPDEAVMWFREWEASHRVSQREDPEFNGGDTPPI